MFETPVVDRTSGDVKQVENRIKNPKGALSHTMLNRIEKNSQYLASLLSSYNYNVEIDVKTDWVREDYFRPSDLDRIKRNVTALKDAYYSLPTTPSLVVGKKTINYVDANNLEQIEKDLDELISYMENNFIYCGVPNCGQNRVWQQRFRKPKIWNAYPYKLSQFPSTDTVAMIATDNNIVFENENQEYKSYTLKIPQKPILVQFDKRDDVFASVQALNDSVQAIDDLVGYECEFYTLTNLCPAIDGTNGFNIRSNSGTGVGESSAVHRKYSQQALKLNIVDTNTTEVYANSSTSLPLNPEHIYYARIEAYQETKFGAVELYFPIAEPQMFNLATGDVGKWNMYSVVKERSSFTAGNYTFRLDFNRERSAETAGSIWYDGWMIIDLTEAFGRGNEPTKEWCDRYIPYFSGVKTIKIRKENA